MWNSYEAYRNIMWDEWAHIGGWIEENPIKQFQNVAKSTVANLKIWSKVEFASRKEKYEKLINQLKHVKQSKAHGVDGDHIRKLEN